MRVVFSAVPVVGHVLPLLAMATAAQADGHHVAVLTFGAARWVMHEIGTLPAPAELFAQLLERIPAAAA